MSSYPLLDASLPALVLLANICSKSFLTSLALLFRTASRCITVHKQEKHGHKLLPRCDPREINTWISQRVLWLTDLSFSPAQVSFHFACEQEWSLKDSKGLAKQVLAIKCDWMSYFAFLFQLLLGGLQTQVCPTAYNSKSCRHSHPINYLLISTQSPSWLPRHSYTSAPEKQRKRRKGWVTPKLAYY